MVRDGSLSSLPYFEPIEQSLPMAAALARTWSRTVGIYDDLGDLRAAVTSGPGQPPVELPIFWRSRLAP